MRKLVAIESPRELSIYLSLSLVRSGCIRPRSSQMRRPVRRRVPVGLLHGLSVLSVRPNMGDARVVFIDYHRSGNVYART